MPKYTKPAVQSFNMGDLAIGVCDAGSAADTNEITQGLFEITINP